jgi:hypothetical protein
MPVATVKAITAAAEKMVSIPQSEYDSLLATAELFANMDVYRFTQESFKSSGKVPLEQAFQR